ncbi:MAG: SdpI family protein [Lachnospiraceae bacterium]|nr:SdpI family protein [Lachnospiraceae bacterium]
MGFWIFMLCMELLIPVMMILFGWIFVRRPPKEINSIYGYRTSRSSKSKESWDFAHRYFGKLWYRWGLVLLPLTAAAMLAVLGKSKDTVGAWGNVLCCLQCIVMLIPIYFTEKALKSRFDENGKPRMQ